MLQGTKKLRISDAGASLSTSTDILMNCFKAVGHEYNRAGQRPAEEVRPKNKSPVAGGIKCTIEKNLMTGGAYVVWGKLF